MAKSLLVVLILMFVVITGYAQNTHGDLAVQHEEETDAAPLIAKLKPQSPDTSQVELICKIAHVYWYKRKLNNKAVDSTLLYARQAYTMSKELHFTEGSNEAAFLICKGLLENKDIDQALKLTNTVYGEEQVRLLLIIAESYVFQSPANAKALDKALPLVTQAKQVSEQIHSLRWHSESMNLMAKLRFNQGNISAGKKIYLEIINTYHQLKDYNNEAKYWSRFGQHMPENNTTFIDIVHSREMAVKFYLLANNKKEAGYSLRELAVIRTNHNQTAEAGKNLMEMLSIFSSIHEPLSITSWYLLGDYYRFTGKYDQALYYGLEGLKAAGNNPGKKVNPYITLAATYAILKHYKKAIAYYQFVLDYQVKTKSSYMFVTCYKITNLIAASGKPGQALSFLNQFLKDHPPASINYQELFASNYGYIYSLLGDNKKAEWYYRQMLNLDDKADEENGKNLGTHLTLTGGGAYYLIGKFYTETTKYIDGKNFLLKSLHNPQYFDKDQELDTYRLLFKADSAMGNYLSAIKYFERHKILSDSINNVATVNKISALNIQYESAQKAKDIKLLENRQKLQQAAIQRSESLRNFTLGGATLLLLLAASLYLGYRSKQRSNNALQLQQIEINAQNAVLQSLLSEKNLFLKEKDNLLEEKDGLLKEKDWLLKEVHHRVKNNLQIIMSLLRTQLAHLKTDDAKGAIIESENRVQAIALIHQKLYHSDKLASISMPAYVSELVNYLSDGLDAKDKQVRFYQSIDMVHVDLAQAVPLGLILNEAITNAIKYGGNDNGTDISLAFHSLDNSSTVMTISDKGRGLPDGFDALTTKSLGMQMMRGLSRQLKGVFEISSSEGVTVTVRFKLIPVFSSGQDHHTT